jgi:hypothetical protein
VKKNTLYLFFAVILTALFVVGIVHLFSLRFELGDVYPPYSSLRADPMGSQILYESLKEIKGQNVSRNFESLDRILRGDPCTFILLGLSPHELTYEHKDTLLSLEHFMRRGGRIIVCCDPLSSDEESVKQFKETLKKSQEQKEKKQGKDKSSDQEVDLKNTVELMSRWGFNLNASSEKTPSGEAMPLFVSYEGDRMITWKSSLYFDELNPAWKVLATRNDKAAVIEKAFGNGTLILSSDSFFLSNEDLRIEQHPEFLTTLFGMHSRIIFDEVHLGVSQEPGLSTLIRKYHLEGVCLGALLVLTLFVWKNAFPLIPPVTPINEALMTGKDEASGLGNLLRKNISSKSVLRTCYDQWKASFKNRRALRPQQAENIEKIINESETARSTAPSSNLVQAYQQIAQILSERK